jgi:tRNA C32,U32 (ribose-2'-O)-methylase TrmJ
MLQRLRKIFQRSGLTRDELSLLRGLYSRIQTEVHEAKPRS